ncbi:Glycosyl hydrolases family 2, TIM barrel domain [Prevotella sp. ne3005]|uniref:sugar-binding domain-containing protein n=1 Tax=Prevotella sp. ne3005 TaxID=1761887 RepID=UPI0008B337C2|nr:sugar-binding domain-containing protein [Prevotella sp. ne3005]SEN14259.1 Glycosyl hydrolases family 2, TIM barrel domain [Prevotella sp. ne3005]
MKRLLLILFTIHSALFASSQEVISLSGSWQFALGDSTKYQDYVLLPGSMQTNDQGFPVTVDTRWTGSLYDSSYYFNPYMEKYRQEGNMKFPFFLTPEKHYVGGAWYRRSVYVPESWKKRHITLYLERPHIETTVYVNGQKVGSDNSLSTPHLFDVTDYIQLGARNTIAVFVYNGIDHVGVGQDSHSVTDQTQGNWNGIVGRMELRAQPQRLHIDKVRIYPQPSTSSVRLQVELQGLSPNFSFYEMEVMIQQEGRDSANLYVTHFDINSKVMDVEMTLLGGAFLWDEFHPNLYRIGIGVGDDYYETTFGMREVLVDGRQIVLNHRPIFLRGTVENCCFPETGYPPTDEAAWLHIFRKCKEYGLNHMRFHSYCPPDAAFAAADKVGFYLQPEGPSWPNHGAKLLAGQTIDSYLLQESKRIVDTYGHHPSFIMMAAGNEPAGNWVEYCNKWVNEMKRYDPTRIYCGASVGGGWAWDDGSEYHVKGGARGLDWDRRAPSSDDDYYSQILRPRNYKDSVDNNSPIIAHEQGQWCAFPDFREIPQYTGVYKARNFEIFRDLLSDNGMASQAEKFLMASGKLQTLCYKYEIERNLRTSDYAGFQLLGLNDYSGQGTALVGALNVHWREKGYTNAREWRQFCSPIVPLARFPKFVYTTADSLVVPVEVYNAMYGNIRSARVNYYINNDAGQVLCGGRLYGGDIPLDKHTPIGTVKMALDSIEVPGKYTLTVSVGGNQYQNHWDFWVYPDTLDSVSHDGILIADSLDAKVLDALKRGGKVLLTAAGKVRLGSDVVQHYLPVFWNTSWFKMRPPHTTGAYIDQQHPLFRHGFPTDDWGDLNWWELLNKAQVMNLQDFPKDYQPPIQPIDTWHISRKLGMLVEAKVLNGSLLMTTMDIASDLDHRIVARQMREAILSYMDSADFAPSLTLKPEVIQNLFTKDGPKVSMFTKESPDELKPKLK